MQERAGTADLQRPTTLRDHSQQQRLHCLHHIGPILEVTFYAGASLPQALGWLSTASLTLYRPGEAHFCKVLIAASISYARDMDDIEDECCKVHVHLHAHPRSRREFP